MTYGSTYMLLGQCEQLVVRHAVMLCNANSSHALAGFGK